MGITNIVTHFSEMNFVILLQLNAFVFAFPFWESAGNSLSNFGRQISDGLDDVWDNSFGGSDANLESDQDEDKSSNGRFLEGIDETLDDIEEALKTLRERIKLHLSSEDENKFVNSTTSSMCSSCNQLGFTTENDTDYWGNDITSGWKRSFASCTDWCLQTPNCEGATYNSNTEFCYLKDSLTVSQYWKLAITGRKCSSVSDCQT